MCVARECGGGGGVAAESSSSPVPWPPRALLAAPGHRLSRERRENARLWIAEVDASLRRRRFVAEPDFLDVDAAVLLDAADLYMQRLLDGWGSVYDGALYLLAGYILAIKTHTDIYDGYALISIVLDAGTGYSREALVRAEVDILQAWNYALPLWGGAGAGVGAALPISNRF